jgi:hypothetical protein
MGGDRQITLMSPDNFIELTVFPKNQSSVYGCHLVFAAASESDTYVVDNHTILIGSEV